MQYNLVLNCSLHINAGQGLTAAHLNPDTVYRPLCTMVPPPFPPLNTLYVPINKGSIGTNLLLVQDVARLQPALSALPTHPNPQSHLLPPQQAPHYPQPFSFPQQHSSHAAATQPGLTSARLNQLSTVSSLCLVALCTGA